MDTKKMNELKFHWSISTIRIFLDNTSENKTIEALCHKEYLLQFLSDLKSDYKMMLEDFGKNDETVKEYLLAINDIENWVPNCD